MQRELGQTKESLTEAKTRVTAAEANVKLFNTSLAKHKDTSLAKHKANVSRFTTALAASKAFVAEL